MLTKGPSDKREMTIPLGSQPEKCSTGVAFCTYCENPIPDLAKRNAKCTSKKLSTDANGQLKKFLPAKSLFIEVCGALSLRKSSRSTAPTKPTFYKKWAWCGASRIREENSFQDIVNMLARAAEHAGGRGFAPKTAITEQNRTLVVCQREQPFHKTPRVAFLFR